MSDDIVALEKLAELSGVRTFYYDNRGQLVRARPAALKAMVNALGIPLATLDDAPRALRDFRRRTWKRCVEPVLVSWGGKPIVVVVRLPENESRRRILFRLRVSGPDGVSVRRFSFPLSSAPTRSTVRIGSVSYVLKRFVLPGALPIGYHELSLEFGGTRGESLVVSAPGQAPETNEGRRTWGVFLPLYALRSRRSWGIGDFTDLGALAGYVGDRGGTVLGTLPILATFLDEPFDYSPYNPASRLFWNELFIDVDRIPDLAECSTARRLVESAGFRAGVEALRRSNLVDYRKQMAHKRPVLFELSRFVATRESGRRAELRSFLEQRPQVVDYARFRAACERHRAPWQRWPRRLARGGIREGDVDPEVERYHIYAQWIAHEQIEDLARTAEAAGVGLYLDLPLGVHPSSYDVYREQDVFMTGVSAGAPPDSFFNRGQDWSFPPFHPYRLRAERYRHFIAVLRHHLGQARVLRIDHVMWLHRLFAIPHGMDASNGVYLNYHADELYAIICLEAHNGNSLVVGEDLGTVPENVRGKMARHGLRGMYIMQYETAPRPGAAPPEVPVNCLAGLNTHDMPTFASYWKGLDIRERVDYGLLDESGAKTERKRRAAQRKSLVAHLRKQGLLREKATIENVLRACLSHLAASRARCVLVNLEDLWLETRPQNFPGTGQELPNWRRKARVALDALPGHRKVENILRDVSRLRA
jgi:4-alpha-glucanotransferase